MATRKLPHGFTLVEVIVAVLLLSIVALGLTTTLTSAQHARALSARWMQATRLAAEGMEQLRAGHALSEPGSREFSREGSVTSWDARLGLNRLEVTVSWIDGKRRSVQLVTLAPR